MPTQISLNVCTRRFTNPPRLWLATLPALVLSALVPASAVADETEDLVRLSIEELSKIEVTSVFKRPETLSESPASIFVITQDEIRRSGAVSLPEVLRLAPNLQVARLNSSSYTVSARGFNTLQASNKLLVLVDGRSVYTPLHAGVFWDQYQVPLQEIERIEVISGPGGTLWGANAVNGIINVITKSAWDVDGGQVLARGGSQDQSLDARFASAVGEKGAIRFYGSGFERGPSRRLGGAEAEDDWKGVQSGFRTDWRLRDSEFTLQGDAFRNTYELGDIDGVNVLGRWTRQGSEDSRTELQVYVDTVTRDVESVLDSLQSVDVQFQQSFTAADRHQIVWGAGHRITRDKFDNDLNFFVLDPERDTVRLSNLFIQDSFATGTNTSLTLGVKLEDSTFSGTELLPSVRFGWHPNEANFLWTAISRAVRTPARLDRYLKAPGLLDPNPDFESEIVLAYEAGYRAQPATNASISVSAFYNDYEDLRMLVLTGNGRFEQANAMHGHTYGLEAWGDLQILSQWRLSLGFNALEKRLTLAPNAFLPVLYQHAGNDPRRQYWLRSSFDLRTNLNFDLSVRAVDDLPQPQIDSYVSLDARIAWRISPALAIALAGSNLLDQAHAESGVPPGLLEIRRAGYLELDWRF